MADKEITLNYIDKLFINLIETGKIINRLLVVQLVVDLVIILFCMNLTLLDPEYSFGGFKFNVTYSFIMASGVWIPGIILVISLAFSKQESELREHIIRLYGSLGFSDESISDRIKNSLEYPNFVLVFTYASKSATGVAMLLKELIFFFIVIILPISVQLFSAYKLIIIFNWNYYVVTSILLLFIFVCYYVIDLVRIPIYLHLRSDFRE